MANEPAKVELGGNQVDRQKNQIDWSREGQNKVLAMTKEKLRDEQLKYKETDLATTKIEAQAGDSVGALALAVDRVAGMKARELTKEKQDEAKKNNPNISKEDLDALAVAKEVDINWGTDVSYRNADGDEILSCNMHEAKILYATDVISFEGTGADVKIIVTLNNEKSLALAEKWKERLDNEAMKGEVWEEWVKKMSNDYQFALSFDKPTLDTEAVAFDKSMARVLPLLDKALANMKADFSKLETGTPESLNHPYNKLQGLRLAPKDAAMDGDTVVMGVDKRSASAIERYLREQVKADAAPQAAPQAAPAAPGNAPGSAPAAALDVPDNLPQNLKVMMSKLLGDDKRFNFTPAGQPGVNVSLVSAEPFDEYPDGTKAWPYTYEFAVTNIIYKYPDGHVKTLPDFKFLVTLDPSEGYKAPILLKPDGNMEKKLDDAVAASEFLRINIMDIASASI